MAPATRLCPLWSFFPRHLQAWPSNLLQPLLRCLPLQCLPPSLLFLCRIYHQLWYLLLVYLFYSLPLPLLECKCQEERGTFICFIHCFIPSTLNNTWHVVGVYSPFVEYMYEWPGLRVFFFPSSGCIWPVVSLISRTMIDAEGQADLSEGTETGRREGHALHQQQGLRQGTLSSCVRQQPWESLRSYII